VQCQVAGGDADQVESLASARAKGIETTFNLRGSRLECATRAGSRIGKTDDGDVGHG